MEHLRNIFRILSHDHAPGRSSSASASLAIVACLPFTALRLAAGQTAATDHQLSTQEWREDLHFLVAQIRLKHKSLFHTMTETAFNQAVEKLDADIPQLNEDQIFVRFLQILAMVQDGHSGFDTRPIPPPADLKDRIPVRSPTFREAGTSDTALSSGHPLGMVV